MENENEYPQEEVVVEEEVTTTEKETESQDETVTISKSEFNKLRRQAIAYKSNKETSKQEGKEIPTITNAFSEEEIEAKILKSQGVDSELINEMRTLAKLRGKSILDIQNDPILIALKESREAQENARKAKLGTSKGSSTVKKGKDFSTPGLSDAEFKELWKAHNNR